MNAGSRYFGVSGPRTMPRGLAARSFLARMCTTAVVLLPAFMCSRKRRRLPWNLLFHLGGSLTAVRGRPLTFRTIGSGALPGRRQPFTGQAPAKNSERSRRPSGRILEARRPLQRGVAVP